MHPLTAEEQDLLLADKFPLPDATMGVWPQAYEPAPQPVPLSAQLRAQRHREIFWIKTALAALILAGGVLAVWALS